MCKPIVVVQAVRVLLLVWLAFAMPISALAEDPDGMTWVAPPEADGAKEIALLAEAALKRYREADAATRLDNVVLLQMAMERYEDAADSLEELVALRRKGPQPLDAAGAIRWQVYLRTRQLERDEGLAFDDAYARAFGETFAQLDDVMASQVIASFGSAIEPYGPQPAQLRADYVTALRAQAEKPKIAVDEAVALVKAWQTAEAYAAFRPLTDRLIEQDDRRRYDVSEPRLVRTPDGAAVTVLVMLPKGRTRPLPTLLGFTIYANAWWSSSELRLTAAHGYAAVVGYSRGKGTSPGSAVPYEHDGVDAAAVIDWIARQPWSDGRVGMYGGSYNGFTQWAAAKHRPKALKALMPSVTAAPGIDVPMEGNVFLSFVYPWAPYAANGKDLDQQRYGDRTRWDALYTRWYTSGEDYRALDVLDGTPNPVFRRWLDHPAYDAYWRAMIPYGREFADIDIPVLTTTGYFDGGQIGALYYFREHYRHDPDAEHYLVIGPYDHVGAQRKARPFLRGYKIDPVALIDISRVLRYQWFDHVFHGAPKPALLADKVNFQVMGANTWRHVPTLDAMSASRRRWYLANDGKALSLADAPGTVPIALTVDLAARDDLPPPDAPLPDLDDRHGIALESPVLPQGTEHSGLFSGCFELVANKRDVDLRVMLYEKKASGEYFQLSWYLARASHTADRTTRHLLVPGRPTHLCFTNGRLTGRLFEPGSRLVATVSVVKGADAQINLGSGKDVSDETVADTGEPLRLQWLPGSFLEVPVTGQDKR